MDQIGEANLGVEFDQKLPKTCDYVSKVYHYLEEYLSGDDMMAEAAEGEIKKAIMISRSMLTSQKRI